MRYLRLLLLLVLPQLAFSQAVWVEHQVSSSYQTEFKAQAADLDGDGDLDIVGASYQDNFIKWWENSDGSGTSWNLHTMTNGYHGAGTIDAADVDGDGDLDILSNAYFDREITFWENGDGSGTNWIEHVINGSYGGGLQSLRAADIDGDGDLDAVSASWSVGVAWWENLDGTGTIWTERPVDYAFLYAFSAYAADLDGDGDLDIIGASRDDDEIVLWENSSGNGLIWTEHLISETFDYPLDVYAADVDFDGHLDVIGGGNGGISWWETDGTTNTGNWIEHNSNGYAWEVSSVYADDVDNDGNLDLLGAVTSTYEIRWWQNDGTNNMDGWPLHTVAENFHQTDCVHCGDFDGDGDIDILGASLHDITWWEQHFPVEVITPNGGEDWRVGTEHNIEWVTPSEQNIVIELLIGPDTELIIAESTENDGSFEWTIPDNVTPGDNYRIRCTLFDGIELDVSDGYFAITALPTLSLTPYLPPIVIPDFGGGFWYWTNISNPSPVSGTGQYWKEVILPSGYTYGPLSVTTMTLGPWEVFAPEDPFPQWVPPYAPAGTYEFVMHVGIFPSLILATDSFEFVKLEGAGAYHLPESDWTFADWNNPDFESELQSLKAESLLLVDYKVSPPYPNPFNPTTSIAVSLPESANLSVVVYNINGRKVAELANGPYSAGQHTFVFDASSVASGIYFFHVKATGHLEQMVKMMLVR